MLEDTKPSGESKAVKVLKIGGTIVGQKVVSTTPVPEPEPEPSRRYGTFSNAMAAARGNPVAGALLYRIEFWCRHASVKADGKRWWALAREDWAAELSVSKKQIDTALKHLKALVLIETDQRKYAGPTPILHVRLTGRAEALLSKSAPAKPKGPSKEASPETANVQPTHDDTVATPDEVFAILNDA